MRANNALRRSHYLEFLPALSREMIRVQHRLRKKTAPERQGCQFQLLLRQSTMVCAHFQTLSVSSSKTIGKPQHPKIWNGEAVTREIRYAVHSITA
jgi:hypothetical protein